MSCVHLVLGFLFIFFIFVYLLEIGNSKSIIDVGHFFLNIFRLNNTIKEFCKWTLCLKHLLHFCNITFPLSITHLFLWSAIIDTATWRCLIDERNYLLITIFKLNCITLFHFLFFLHRTRAFRPSFLKLTLAKFL